MAVGLRGYTQGSVAGVGTSVSWPAGSAAGDLALVHCGGSYPNNGPQTSGWTPCGHKSYWKILTSTDIATALVVNASHVKLQVFTGAKSIGRTSTQNGLTVQAAGSYLFVESARSASSIAPATYRLGTEWTDENGYWQAAYAMASGAGWAAIPSMGSGATSYSYEVLPASILTTPALSEIKQTSLKVAYSGNGDGGSPITAWETGYGTDPNAPQTIVTSLTNPQTLTGLSPGQVYYVWGRGWNQYGPGAWSARSTATLLAGAWVDVDGVKKRAVPYVRDGGVWKVAESWTKIEGVWKESG